MATVTETVVPERATSTAADHFRAAARVLVGGVSGSARVNPGAGPPLARRRRRWGAIDCDRRTAVSRLPYRIRRHYLGPQPPGGAGGYRTGAGHGGGARPGDRLPATAGGPDWSS